MRAAMSDSGVGCCWAWGLWLADCQTALPSASGITIQATTYPMSAVPPVIRVSPTMASRTRVASMLKYSARPPDTPESIRWLRERRSDLPDRFENGALEFVMSPTLPAGPLPPHRDRYRPDPGPTPDPAQPPTPAPLTTFVGFCRWAVVPSGDGC